MNRLTANYKAYAEMARLGVPSTQIEEAFEEGDLLNIQDQVMKRYWAHVRDLMRKVPVFEMKLNFLSNFFERPIEEVLDSIATEHFPRLTMAVEQRNHNMLRQWITELYDSAQDQLKGAVPVDEDFDAGIDQPPFWRDDDFQEETSSEERFRRLPEAAKREYARLYRESPV